MTKPTVVTEVSDALPIAPELYQQTLERLELLTICLERANVHCQRELFEGSETKLSLEASAEDRQDPAHYSIFATYCLQGRQNKEITIKVEATYRLVFRTAEPIPVGFFEVFRELNLRLITMPYFRELLASMTGRMELPTLTIPLKIFAGAEGETSDALGVCPPEPAKPPRKTRRSKASSGAEA